MKPRIDKVRVGRKPKYTPTTLRNRAYEYFGRCDATVVAKDPKTGMNITKPKTMTGLQLYLGVCPDFIRKKYEHPSYKVVIDEIRMMLENSIEEGILIGKYNSTAGVFSLKNKHGWKDKIETENKNETEITFKIKE